MYVKSITVKYLTKCKTFVYMALWVEIKLCTFCLINIACVNRYMSYNQWNDTRLYVKQKQFIEDKNCRGNKTLIICKLNHWTILGYSCSLKKSKKQIPKLRAKMS